MSLHLFVLAINSCLEIGLGSFLATLLPIFARILPIPPPHSNGSRTCGKSGCSRTNPRARMASCSPSPHVLRYIHVIYGDYLYF
jgi:hypothetical protein